MDFNLVNFWLTQTQKLLLGQVIILTYVFFIGSKVAILLKITDQDCNCQKSKQSQLPQRNMPLLHITRNPPLGLVIVFNGDCAKSCYSERRFYTTVTKNEKGKIRL